MGGFRRALFGGVVGAIAGGSMSDSNTGTGVFQSAALGALAGAGAGAATSRSLWTSARRGAGAWQQFKGPFTSPMAKMAGAGAWGGVKAGYHVGRAGLRGAHAGARFALNHPRAAILGAGAAYGTYALASSGVGESGMDTGEMAAIAKMHGGPSTGFDIGMGTDARQEARSMFMDSTFGLTQGLHRGRHR